MIHDKGDNNVVLVHALKQAVNSYWDKMVSGKMDDDDVQSLYKLLIDITSKNNFSQTMSRFMAGISDNDTIVSLEMKTVLTDAMMKEFLFEEHPLQDWTMLLISWDIVTMFRVSFKESLKIDRDRCVESVRRVSVPVFAQPEHLVYSYERNRLISSIETWKKEDDIIEFWKWGSRDFFPYDADAFIIPNMLLPEEPKEFFEISSYLKEPSLLGELYASACRTGDVNYALNLLGATPECVGSNNKQWNKSWVAPALLDVVYNRILNEYSPCGRISIECRNELLNKFEELGNTLHARKDGFYLAWEYVKYLSNNRMGSKAISNICINGLSRVFQDIAKDEYPSADVLAKFFSEDVNGVRNFFIKVGVLKQKQSQSVFAELVTWINFFCDDQDYMARGLFYLETALMYDDDGIYANEVSLNQYHYKIASMYVDKSGNINTQGWIKSWDLFAMARYRVRFDYYNENSHQVRIRLNFLLLIAVALFEISIKVKKWEAANLLWEKLMGIMEDRLQNKFSNDDFFNVDYVKTLYKLKKKQLENMHETDCDGEKSASDKMVKYIHKLESYPDMYQRVKVSIG